MPRFDMVFSYAFLDEPVRPPDTMEQPYVCFGDAKWE